MGELKYQIKLALVALVLFIKCQMSLQRCWLLYYLKICIEKKVSMGELKYQI